MRHAKGFSLVSLVIALGLVSVASVLAIQYQLRQSRAKLAQTWIDAQAREMDQIVAAVRTWTNSPSNTASWANDTRTAIPCDTLINAGLLPTAFGRDNTFCKSPFGTVYVIRGIKNFSDSTLPQGRVRAVIFVTGSPAHSSGILRRAGIPNTSAGIQGIAMRVASGLAERKVAAGWLPAGSTVTTGVGRAWTKTITNWLGTAPVQASAVAFVGFPDLEPNSNLNNDLPPFTSCRIVADLCGRTSHWGGCVLGWQVVPSYCAADEVQVKVFDACAPAQLEFVSGINATLTGGGADVQRIPGRTYSECMDYGNAACIGNPDPGCASAKAQECNLTPSADTTIITTISLNNERQLATACGFSDDTWSGQGAGAALFNVTNGAQQKFARVCCTPY